MCVVYELLGHPLFAREFRGMWLNFLFFIVNLWISKKILFKSVQYNLLDAKFEFGGNQIQEKFELIYLFSSNNICEFDNFQENLELNV